MLGLQRCGDTFRVAPCIPSWWPEYEIDWRVGCTRYVIAVSNPERQWRGVSQAFLDDITCDAAAIPIVDDGQIHRVRIVLGGAPAV
jgi:cellobiose phosphorylase